MKDRLTGFTNHETPSRAAASLRLGVYLLAFVGLVGVSSGCGRLEALRMIEERPMALTHATGCRTTAPTAPRGWHYRAQLDLGERPDSSSASSSVSAITRTVRTTAIDPGISTRSVLMVLQILVMLLAMVLTLLLIRTLAEKRWPRAAVLAVVLGGLAVATLVLGYASGSVLSIDNATDMPVRVTVDGTVVDVPARSMTELRVSGPDVVVTTEVGGMPGVPLEQLSIALDGNPLGTLMRLTFGDGRYVYSVCGANHYGMGHHTYR